MNVMNNLFFLFALLILLSSAWSQEEAAPSIRKSNLLARRPVGSRPLGRGASTTTTTTTAAPIDDEILENSDENVEENNDAGADENGSDEPVATTPAPKKQPLKLAIRPFRSNDDLLQALKRRQQNTKSAKKVASFKPAADEENEEELQKGVPSPSTLPVHSQRNARKRFGGTKPSLKKAEQEPVEEAAQAIEDVAEAAASPSLPATLARRAVRSRYTGKRN